MDDSVSPSEAPTPAAAHEGSLAALTTFVAGVADAVAPVSLGHFRHPLSIEHKADESPVTIADREVESAIRALIAHQYPDHGILGEEEGGAPTTEGPLWVIDPIDGTRSFIAGIPLYGTLIAFLVDGRPRIGMIDMPALKERWMGAADRPTTFNDRPCRTSDCRDLAAARLAATSIDLFEVADRERFDALTRAVWQRQFGGDCYLYGALASGGLDLVVESNLKPYDFCALAPVVAGAGGVMTDWQGRPLTVASDGRVLAAATPDLHAQALAYLSSD
ncbi:MAG: histidinol-phosphatase [Inquilinus sp.]|nr:histidinol-phosphatase [Inquilinus sp.]